MEILLVHRHLRLAPMFLCDILMLLSFQLLQRDLISLGARVSTGKQCAKRLSGRHFTHTRCFVLLKDTINGAVWVVVQRNALKVTLPPLLNVVKLLHK